MADFFTSHTIYCNAADINSVIHPGVRVVEKAEISNANGRMWRVTFLTPTNEQFLQRMGIIKEPSANTSND